VSARVFALLPFVLLTGVPAGAQSACEALRAQENDTVRITLLESVPAGEFVLQGGRGGPRALTDLPDLCRIGMTISPVEGSTIGVELWLPGARTWNGRYVVTGNGAFAGSISTNAIADLVRQGYAASSTDTGHTSPGGAFALDEVQRVDFAWRAVHEMAARSKTLIEAFYGRPQEYALFNGCSTGGRQALTAAERFPLDFDGIVAGAPANYVSHLQGQQIWLSRVGRSGEGAPIPTDKLRLVNEAVLGSCDLDDGVADRVIENPRACSFDPGTLACEGDSGDMCLTAGELQTLRTLYRGPTGADGTVLFPGPVVGSETGWGQMTGPRPLSLAEDTYRYMVFEDETWTAEAFVAARDIPDAAERIGPVMDATDPDLTPLVENGGKLLIYHGWADPGITPHATVEYYEDVLSTMGESARDSIRLFMVPGMGHCGGGEGPGSFDALGEIDRWVTTGQPPDRIVASRTRGGEVDRTRPLCPFPEIAVYHGSGSTDQAENFTCRLRPQ
jgi:feruloyl esterase